MFSLSPDQFRPAALSAASRRVAEHRITRQLDALIGNKSQKREKAQSPAGAASSIGERVECASENSDL